MLLNAGLIGIGGALGSVTRYLFSLMLRSYLPGVVFAGTLVVNVVGCFLIGSLSSYAEKHILSQSPAFLFLSTGILGGLTTFSAFGLESVTLFQNQQLIQALGSVFLNLGLGFGAVLLGRCVF